jgi:hypothetical protein
LLDPASRRSDQIVLPGVDTDSVAHTRRCRLCQAPIGGRSGRGRPPDLCDEHVRPRGAPRPVVGPLSAPPPAPDDCVAGAVAAAERLGRDALARMQAEHVARQDPTGVARILDAQTRDRVRAVIYTGHLTELESNKGHREGWEGYDLNSLQLAALKVVVENMGLEEGITRAQLVDDLLPGVAAMDPDAAVSRHLEVAEEVVGHLLNDAHKRAARQVPYKTWDPATGRTVELVCAVRLLTAEQTPDGTVVIEATPEAINLLVQSWGVDLHERQRAQELLLEEQLKAGRFDLTAGSAEQARRLSVSLSLVIRDLLLRARRDISRLNWDEEVDTRLVTAIEHIEGRSERERHIVDFCEEAIDIAADHGMRAQLDRTVAHVRAARQQHIRLLRDLIPVHDRLLAEQDRQRFARPALRADVDCQRQLFEPVIAMTVGQAWAVAEAFVSALAVPRLPAVPCLDTLVERLLEPARELPEEREPAPELVFDISGERERRFSDDEYAAARCLLASVALAPRQLSVLLTEARVSGTSLGVRELVVLGALAAWAQEERVTLESDEVVRVAGHLIPEGLRATADGTRFTEEEYSGDDLRLHWLAVAQDERS